MIDLHIHSTYSDGQYSPAQILNAVKNSEIALMSITDHDTVAGIKEGKEIAEKYGILFISGIEISVEHSREMHILGYGIDVESEIINNACQKFINLRKERTLRIIKFLNKYGFDISIDELKSIAGNQVIARPHFAQIMLNKGYIECIREAYDKYLDTDDFKRIDVKKITFQEGIKIIHDAGGIAVLAHPVSMKLDVKEFENQLRKLVDSGLDGIETYHSTHTKKQINEFERLAYKYNLIQTCGSDFHGEKIKPKITIGCNVNGEKLIADYTKECLIYKELTHILKGL